MISLSDRFIILPKCRPLQHAYGKGGDEDVVGGLCPIACELHGREADEEFREAVEGEVLPGRHKCSIFFCFALPTIGAPAFGGMAW